MVNIYTIDKTKNPMQGDFVRMVNKHYRIGFVETEKATFEWPNPRDVADEG